MGFLSGFRGDCILLLLSATFSAVLFRYTGLGSYPGFNHPFLGFVVFICTFVLLFLVMSAVIRRKKNLI